MLLIYNVVKGSIAVLNRDFSKYKVKKKWASRKIGKRSTYSMKLNEKVFSFFLLICELLIYTFVLILTLFFC